MYKFEINVMLYSNVNKILIACIRLNCIQGEVLSLIEMTQDLDAEDLEEWR